MARTGGSSTPAQVSSQDRTEGTEGTKAASPMIKAGSILSVSGIKAPLLCSCASVKDVIASIVDGG